MEVTGREQFVNVLVQQLLAMPARAAVAEFVQMRENLRTRILIKLLITDKKKYSKLAEINRELANAEDMDYQRLIAGNGEAKARKVEIKYDQMFSSWYGSLQHGWTDEWD